MRAGVFFLILTLCLFSSSIVAEEEAVKSYIKNLQGTVREFEWCGTNEIFSDETDQVQVLNQIEDSFDTRLFILSSNGKAYQSSNYGKTWVDLNDKFSKLYKGSTNGDFSATEISVSPVDGKTVYVWGKDTASYTADECGKSWQMINHPPGLFDFRFHRQNRDWILAFQKQICAEFDDDCDSSLKKLLVSTDAGQSFRTLQSNVKEATWNRMNNFYSLKSPGIIIVQEKEGNSNIVYSDDFGENYYPLMDGGDNFFQSENFLFVTMKPKSNKQSYQLKIATLYDDFKTYLDPQNVVLPFEAKDHLSFTILKSEGSQVFLSVRHKSGSFEQSNVYVSDWRGYQLSLSLLYNVRGSEGDCDFEKVDSNEGVFIANTYDSVKVEQLKVTQARNEQSQKIHLFESLANFKKTVISFDNGGNWHPILAPTTRQNGKPYLCSGECSLHLVGRSTTMPGIKGQIFTSSNAPGLIAGIGSVGHHLVQKSYELNTYLSNDGGHTWREILAGPHIIEIGDHGGILLAFSMLNRTNVVSYSWDEGTTWEEYKLPTEPFTAITIETEPSNMDQRFIISGRGKEEDTSIIVLVDLSDLHTRACTGSDHPGRQSSDYEVWTPTNFLGEKCIFGRKYSYIRRKTNAKCFNTILKEEKMMLETCPCSEEDWECDFGFYHKDNKGECVPLNSHFALENLQMPPEKCIWKYSITKGYRKVPSVYCDGGVDKQPEFKDCPPKIVQARTEEQSKEYLAFRQEQDRLIQMMFNNQKRKQETIQAESGSIFSTIALIFLIAALLGAAVYFREYLRFIISSIGEIGSKQFNESRQYESADSSKKKNKKSKESKVRIQSEDRNYDAEDPYEQSESVEERPVLLRDQQEYFSEY